MAPSYRNVNYDLRIAKNIERKLIIDVVLSMSQIVPSHTMQYVGFGSPYFNDFRLFHRRLGIEDMISIERETSESARFEFNKPFGCVQMKYGESTQVIPQIDLSRPTIIWLDYDDKISDGTVEDVRLLSAAAAAGSLLFVSLNSEPERGVGDATLQALRDRTENSQFWFSPELRDQDLRSWGLAELSIRVVRSVINTTLAGRNAPLLDTDRLSFHPLLALYYKDGARMATLGGIFANKDHRRILDSCDMSAINDYRDPDNPFKIEIPRLTLREIRHLDSLMPGHALDLTAVSKKLGIPESDLRRFRNLYRHFPSFQEAEA